MNDQSPPKRVTRARAAAKSTTDTDVKTTKIATAASRAKVTRNAPTTKRKTRTDKSEEDANDELADQVIEPEQPKITRGRAKKTTSAAITPKAEMEDETSAPVKTTRGRPKKAAAAVETPAPPATRSLRGRAKTIELDEEATVVDEPVKKPTRTRTGTISRATVPKKTVKFEEPDKENVMPQTNTKGKAKVVETGLKAKPVRKPATTTSRATRGRAKGEEKDNRSTPLSPKKATQVSTVKDQSEDELATNEKTPMKPLMKSPVKAPGSIFGTAKKLNFSHSITVNRAELGESVMGSPARRPPQSPFKESLTTSPQRSALGDSMLRSPFKFAHPGQKTAQINSPLKASLLQSPARRPQSPIKVTGNGSPGKPSNVSVLSATPKASAFKLSRFTTPRTLTKSAVRPGQMLPPANTTTASPEANKATNPESMAEPSLKFSGRLSSIMPREADPALSSTRLLIEEIEDEVMADEEGTDEVILIDTMKVEDTMDIERTTPPASPSQTNRAAFALREDIEGPFQDSDSEDELASRSPRYSPAVLTGFRPSSHNFASSPATPTPFAAMNKTPGAGSRRQSVFAQKEKIGFTPLAQQLSNWMAPSPIKSEYEPEHTTKDFQYTAVEDEDATIQSSALKSTYFEDEMTILEEMDAPSAPDDAVEDIDYEPVELDEEDLSLAHEADEMSLLDPEAIEQIQSATRAEEQVEVPAENRELTFDDLFTSQPEEIETQQDTNELVCEPALSEASQEYGDENAVPLDPALFVLSDLQAPPTPIYSTPKRVLSERVFHTVSKVPLKPAAEDSPVRASAMKRSASVSRLPVQRPSSNLSRSNTVISYSPSKKTPRASLSSKDVEMEDVCTTPEKFETEVWSTIATPARTPRRDLNATLLKGAVVFVDVHTTEGADASTLFTELLTQMGARCVKRWDWNGNSEDGKVGITHVVFKDGGRRTLEKARETGGVVSCVGVGWVLE